MPNPWEPYSEGADVSDKLRIPRGFQIVATAVKVEYLAVLGQGNGGVPAHYPYLPRYLPNRSNSGIKEKPRALA
jgi:hypothetical protein